ncbi:MAG: hypothetical protein U9Q98_04970 [Bacteroidota bacterium]|nr:hypothetical protein [Bacteroidota bacterium]
MHTYIKASLVAGMFTGFLLFFTSCEDNDRSFLNQDRIYTSYELYYNGNADKTYARATFKLGNKYGTLLKLGDNSSIGITRGDSIYDPESLTFMNEYGYYEKEHSFYMFECCFYFTDEEENQYINSISVPSATFPETIDTIVRDNTWQLSWDKDYSFQKIALEENESISLTFKGIADGDVHTFYQFEESSESIVLDSDETSELEPGTYTLILDRRYQPELTQKTSAGGTITGRYRPANRTVVVVEE